MKRMLLLLFSVGTLTTVFAQDRRYNSDRDDARTVILGRNDQHAVYNNSLPRPDNRNTWDIDNRRKQDEINKVNREYDRRIDAVQHNARLQRKERSREISRLQREKEQAVREINIRYERLDQHRNDKHDNHGRY